MKRTIFFMRLTLSLYMITLINSAAAEDLVKNLYGDLYKGEVYSGYLKTADPQRKLHYVFLPSQSNPAKDPVVLWLNGGPGCSSLLGLFMENGPVVLDDYDPEWRVNDYSWNKKASMLYIESPAGVGFSYTEKGDEDLKSNDEKSSIDNERAVLDFFTKFYDYSKNDFYISGESYAGVYVPWLAKRIIQNNDSINLKGIIVGNGLTDWTVDVEEGLIDFAYQHTLYPSDVYEDFNKYCSEKAHKGRFTDYHPNNVTRACNEVRQKIRDSLQGLNIYDIYRECPASPSDQKEIMTHQKALVNSLKKFSMKKRAAKLSMFGEDFRDEDLEPELHIWPDGCKADLNLDSFLNNQTVKDQLHVKSSITWMQCNGDINQNYSVGDASFAIYRDVLIKKTDLRIWFYSGDTDAAVPYTGSIRWIPRLNMNISEEYRSWRVNNQTAGFVQSYGNNFKYITIKGTGHMAPQWKKPEGFTMINAFLNGEDLPK